MNIYYNDKTLYVNLEELINNNNLKTLKKRVFGILNDYDIDLNFGVNSNLFIDFIQKNDNSIEITDIIMDLNGFEFKGISKSKVNKIFLQNSINFNKFYFPVAYEDETNFNFIPCCRFVGRWFCAAALTGRERG